MFEIDVGDMFNIGKQWYMIISIKEINDRMHPSIVEVYDPINGVDTFSAEVIRRLMKSKMTIGRYIESENMKDV